MGEHAGAGGPPRIPTLRPRPAQRGSHPSHPPGRAAPAPPAPMTTAIRPGGSGRPTGLHEIRQVTEVAGHDCATDELCDDHDRSVDHVMVPARPQSDRWLVPRAHRAASQCSRSAMLTGSPAVRRATPAPAPRQEPAGSAAHAALGCAEPTVCDPPVRPLRDGSADPRTRCLGTPTLAWSRCERRIAARAPARSIDELLQVGVVGVARVEIHTVRVDAGHRSWRSTAIATV